MVDGAIESAPWAVAVGVVGAVCAWIRPHSITGPSARKSRTFNMLFMVVHRVAQLKAIHDLFIAQDGDHFVFLWLGRQKPGDGRYAS